MKRPFYLVFMGTGERIGLNESNELHPNEYAIGERVILVYEPNDPNESLCFEVDDPNDPDRATTIPFELYSNDGTLLARRERVTVFWL